MPRAFTETERVRIRAALLAAGREALARGGLRRTPVEKLTSAAGISKGAYYLFFPTKEALVAELLVEAEAETRAALLAVARGPGADPLRAVLVALFDAVVEHPLLIALRDPEEFAWLVRALPEGTLAEARIDDDRWFTGLLTELQASGAVGEIDPVVFAGIAPAALALVHGRLLVGEDRWRAVVELVIDGLVERLTPR